jgi:hypothetical protein
MGSKTIYVDEEVYALINQQVQGLDDTANRVVRRMIGLDVEPHIPHGYYSPAVAAVLATLRDAHGDLTTAEIADTAGSAGLPPVQHWSPWNKTAWPGVYAEDGEGITAAPATGGGRSSPTAASAVTRNINRVW